MTSSISGFGFKAVERDDGNWDFECPPRNQRSENYRTVMAPADLAKIIENPDKNYNTVLARYD